MSFLRGSLRDQRLSSGLSTCMILTLSMTSFPSPTTAQLSSSSSEIVHVNGCLWMGLTEPRSKTSALTMFNDEILRLRGDP